MKKVISSSAINQLADHYICQQAAEEDIALGVALKNLSKEDLLAIVRPADRYNASCFRRRIRRERTIWGVAMAAMMAVAITIPFYINTVADQQVDNIIYSYNSPTLELLTAVPRGGGERITDIRRLDDAQLKSQIPELKEEYDESEELQDVAINGRILALAYLRLHHRKEARQTLQTMIGRLSEEPADYQAVIDRCQRILSEI